MNNQQNSQGPFKKNSSNVDKTFVEGSTPLDSPAQTRSSDLKPGLKIDATSAGKTNPYTTKTTVPRRSPGDILPSGNEPIPVGSGTIVGVLGCGGMARVYKIWNEKLEVFRAVKILLPNHQDDLLNRFETEAKITAKLHHQNIVEIYNVGEWNGLPFLEMEYIDGMSIEGVITKHGKLPDVVCSAIAIYVAKALSYAHCQEFLIYGKTYHGIIHRDLKPANIMLSSHGGVRLMDFGIARPTEASLHTVEGNIVGTMQYLSPEQLDGIDVDCRTDIYSFGAILYEMLTGNKTFPQDTITNLMRKKITNEYRKFSDFEFSILPALTKIAQKCLHINKEDRYPSVDALLSDLEEVHRELTSESPDKILQRFIEDPESIQSSAQKKFLPFKFKLPIKVSKKTALIAGISSALVAVLVLAIIFIGSFINNNGANEKNIAVKDHVNGDGENEIIEETTVPEPPEPKDDIDEKEEPVTPPAPEPPVVINKRPDKPPPPPPTPKTPLGRLKAKYNTDDLMEIGKVAMKKNAHNDVILALENLPGSSDQKIVILLEAYLNTQRTSDALGIVRNHAIDDGHFYFLSGKALLSFGNKNDALGYFEKTLTKPTSYRSVQNMRKDALYYIALIRSDNYKANRNEDTRFQALNAWNTVKRMYSDTPQHSRFKRANTELASIN